jgi:hypothetical protein
MLTISVKKYEIEEQIKSLDENENILYEFTMQITPEEMQKISNLMFDAESIAKAEEYNKLFQDEKFEEANKLLAQIDEISKKNQEEFENVCFKEHKELFKKASGEYKYAEMVDLMQSFFWNIFISKKNKQVNIMLTDLMKITQK